VGVDPKQKNEPGQGFLYTSKNPRSDRAPTMWGLVRMDKDVKAGDIVKIVGWKYDTRFGLVVNLRIDNWDPKFGKKEARPYRRHDQEHDDNGGVPF